ncbi:protein of unknown function [Agrobacterium pusense]|uniref:Uncharacterized protein n=1 Tax=Agrobacterium pusense TaxID=648995 RepID=U4QBB1_9HYPH|nr:protein of unknown function [Agrobacterium pusense]
MQSFIAERILMKFDSHPRLGLRDGDHPFYECESILTCGDINIWKRFSVVHALSYSDNQCSQQWDMCQFTT